MRTTIYFAVITAISSIVGAVPGAAPADGLAARAKPSKAHGHPSPAPVVKRAKPSPKSHSPSKRAKPSKKARPSKRATPAKHGKPSGKPSAQPSPRPPALSKRAFGGKPSAHPSVRPSKSVPPPSGPSKRATKPSPKPSPRPSKVHPAPSKRARPSVSPIPHPHPSPAPSGKPKAKREMLDQLPMEDMSEMLCPTDLWVCPVTKSEGRTMNDLLKHGFECVDFLSDLESCGGCGLIDQVHDCTAIPSAKGVSCDEGFCQVNSCQDGFIVSDTGDSCVRA